MIVKSFSALDFPMLNPSLLNFYSLAGTSFESNLSPYSSMIMREQSFCSFTLSTLAGQYS